MDTQNDGLGSSIGSTCDCQEASRPSMCPDCTCRKAHWHRTWKWSCDRWLWSNSHSWHQSCKSIGMIIVLKPFWWSWMTSLWVSKDMTSFMAANTLMRPHESAITNIVGLFLFAWSCVPHIYPGSADVFPDVLHMSFTCKHVHSLLLHSKALHCLRLFIAPCTCAVLCLNQCLDTLVYQGFPVQRQLALGRNSLSSVHRTWVAHRHNLRTQNVWLAHNESPRVSTVLVVVLEIWDARCSDMTWRKPMICAKEIRSWSC